MSSNRLCKHGILNDATIRHLCTPIESFDQYDGAGAEFVKRASSGWKPMIEPFEPRLIRHVKMPHVPAGQTKVISFGTTSYGYDVRLSDKQFKIFTPTSVTEIDPMNFDPECLVDAPVKIDPRTGLKYVTMPAHSYALGHTMEYFHMPRDVLAICLGKSTYARGAVGINATPIEPGFEGTVVLELTNFAPVPVRIYLETGISQFVFFKGEQDCEESYGDRGGKYQGQQGLQLPLV